MSEEGAEKELAENFERFHYAKIRYHKEDGRFYINDNFNQLSFIGTIAANDDNHVLVHDMEGEVVFSILKTAEDKFRFRSPWAEGLGETVMQEKGRPEELAMTMYSKDKASWLQAFRVPLIEKSNEFQVTQPKSGDVVGRINIVRSKAVVSMQPELEVFHRLRIIGTAIVLMQKYEQHW